MNYREKLIVKPKSKLKLKDKDARWHGEYKSHKRAKSEIKKNLEKLAELQYLLYAENKHSLLIILQGLDAAGKDGVIRHVLTSMNPQGCTVTGFKQPTPIESSHDFLWRAHPHAPHRGEVAIFNRSYYEDVLITRVHKIISREKCSERYHLINGFEKLIVDENETTVLKFFIHISKREQLARFGKRLKNTNKQWKISEGDYSEREHWDGYEKAFEDLLTHTSTESAPWFVIPSDHKWFRDLAISQIIATTLESFKMKPPESSVDLDEIRRKYHSAILKQKVQKTKLGRESGK